MSALPTHIKARLEARDERLAAQGFQSYEQYLNSTTWTAVKARYRAAGLAQECLCGATDVQMHHLTYERVGGDEQLEDLMPLCTRCHAMVHALERRGDIDLDLSGLTFDQQRAAAHRAHLAKEASRRAMKRAAFDELPLHERVRRLRIANAKHGYPASRDLRLIEYQIAKAEAKSLRIQRRAVRVIEHASRRAADSMDTHAPESLNTLMPELPDVSAPPAELRVVKCQDSMTCECPACSAERERCIARGVRSRGAANALRSIERRAA